MFVLQTFSGDSTDVPESFFDKKKENEEILLDYYRAERMSPDGPHDIEARHLTMVSLLAKSCIVLSLRLRI